MTTPSSRLLEPGDPLPWSSAPLLAGAPDFRIERIAGQHLLLLAFGSADRAGSTAALRLVAAEQGLFDDERCVFFGITVDPQDAAKRRISHRGGLHFLLDHDRRASIAIGAATPGVASYRPHWLLVDPMLRVLARFPLEAGQQAIAATHAAVQATAGDLTAPVLTVPNVLEPEFRRALIDLYDRHGGTPSGFMREVDGRTVGVHDTSRKRRSDHTIEQEPIRAALRERIGRRLAPMIERAFSFRATRIERYIVACYDGSERGHFAAHRDNTTRGTAHRRFACTINLNDGYDGGDLCFPEFGPRTYRAPAGGAVVFSCSLMHEARPVTSGLRYATLPFLYDDAAARVREANQGALEGGGGYRAEPTTSEEVAAADAG